MQTSSAPASGGESPGKPAQWGRPTCWLRILARGSASSRPLASRPAWHEDIRGVN